MNALSKNHQFQISNVLQNSDLGFKVYVKNNPSDNILHFFPPKTAGIRAEDAAMSYENSAIR